MLALASPPLLPGEKAADYFTIASDIVKVSGPRDAIEEFLIRDVIDHTWEIQRYRRAKAAIIRASLGDGVRGILAGFGHSSGGSCGERDTLSHRWAAGDKSVRRKVGAFLTKAGITTDEVTAKTLELKLGSLERLDRMEASAEARRSKALWEIDCHRESVGAAARKAIEAIEAKLQEVEPGEIEYDNGLIELD